MFRFDGYSLAPLVLQLVPPPSLSLGSRCLSLSPDRQMALTRTEHTRIANSPWKWLSCDARRYCTALQSRYTARKNFPTPILSQELCSESDLQSLARGAACCRQKTFSCFRGMAGHFSSCLLSRTEQCFWLFHLVATRPAVICHPPGKMKTKKQGPRTLGHD